MNKFFLPAAALCLLFAAPPVAMAQPDRHDRDHRYERRDNDRRDWDRRDWDRRNDRRDDRRDNYWNRDRSDVRRDLRDLRRNYNAPRRYRVGVYNPPRGYRYQRWTYGQRLPASYYARNYWLMNFAAYGLLAPPSGYTWVRVGPDAMLIDRMTGEIVRVSYNAFY